MPYPLPTLGPEEGVRLWRDAEGGARANIRHRMKLNSEEGFDFGEDNEGAADLAVNILIDFGMAERDAVALHRSFLNRFLRRLPEEGGEIPADDIHEWIELRLMGEEEEEEVEEGDWEGHLPGWEEVYSSEGRFAREGEGSFGLHRE